MSGEKSEESSADDNVIEANICLHSNGGMCLSGHANDNLICRNVFAYDDNRLPNTDGGLFLRRSSGTCVWNNVIWGNVTNLTAGVTPRSKSYIASTPNRPDATLAFQ